MLDYFCILHKGGLVLWKFDGGVVLRGQPVNDMIQQVLMEDRAGLSSFQKNEYLIKWSLANKEDLVFIAVYQRTLALTYVDKLLSKVKESFVKEKKSFLNDKKKIHECLSNFDYRTRFNEILTECEKNPYVSKSESSSSSSGKDSSAGNGSGSVKSPSSKLSKLQKLQEQKKKKGQKTPTKGSANGTSSNNSSSSKKVKRQWGDKISQEEEDQLDYAKKAGHDTSIEKLIDQTMKNTSESSRRVNLSDDEESDDDADADGAGNSEGSGSVWSFFSKLTGKKMLEPSDLEQPLTQLQNHLVGKNVALEVAQQLCESVSANLVGKESNTFMGLNKLVTESMTSAMTRILTPNRTIDILRDIEISKKKNEPFVIVFIGVNGVGKSTSLAKVCSWLQQNNKKILIAACDTFRSGAVEQLRVHAKCLDVELYEKGYNRDAASVAADAIKKAKLEDTDVVLVDTAGRMQDNEPLMRSLTKLVSVNKPNLLLFVGEALVGNEAVDQLSKFNQAMRQFSPSNSQPRLIDGIVLTKFDTVDEKIGAAISMVYTTGQPIVFVGTGQHYSDLKKLNINQVIKTLLK